MATQGRPALTSTSSISARADLLATELSPTEAVMLDIDKGSYFGVDSVAKTIWDAVTTPCSMAEICQLVEQTYDVSPSIAHEDTAEFLGELFDAGLITIDNNGIGA